MIGPFLRINAVTRADRDETIARVRAAITASGAWIVDVKLFSNVSVCFSFDVPRNSVGLLRGALATTPLHLTKESNDLLASQLEHVSDGSHGPDIAGTLQITFIHNEPDLRIDVPKIPG